MLAALLGAILAAAQIPPAVTIDVTRGEIDGQTALAFWPSERTDENPTDPAGYTVRLSPVDDLDRELVFPAGNWFRPPRGQYVVWVEGRDKSSWTSNVVAVADSPFKGRGRAAVFPVRDAGTVHAVAPFPPSADLRVRLIHLESHNKISEFPQEEFSRRTPLDAPAGSVTMPVGRAVAGVYSKEKSAYLALSRPFAIEKGKEAAPRLAPPAAGQADLMILFERPEPVRTFEAYDLAATLSGAGWSRPADVLIPTARRTYAIWYGLSASAATLAVSSSHEFLAETSLELGPGKVERRVIPLLRRPKVYVRLDLPEPLRKEAGQLLVEVAAGRRSAPLRQMPLDGEAVAAVLENLPPAELHVVVRAPPWVFRQEVDLRDGADREITFAPLGTAVSGQVLLGGEEQAAEIAFSTDLAEQQNHVVLTDEQGRFSTWLWRPGTYLVALRCPNRQEPYRVVTEIPAVAETVVDFEVPGALYRLRAIDRRTRKEVPIDRAEFSLEAEQGSTLSFGLDPREGVAELPPLPAGKLEVKVAADGYREKKVAGLEITEEGPGETFTVEIEKVTSILELELRRADGQPARGAEVRIQQNLGSPEALWNGRSDDGMLTVPGDLAGSWALVRAPDSGFYFALLPPGQEKLKWRLPPPSPRLAVRIVDAGGEPVGRADLAVGIGPDWLSGIPLAWLTRSRAVVADLEGVYRLEGLPGVELELLASRAALPPNLGPLAPLASRVGFPRPASLELRALAN